MMKLTSLAISACIAFSAMATPSTAETPGDAKNSQSNYFPATSDELLDLIKNCDTDDCMSYISGVIGGIAIYAIIAEKPSPFCTRGNVDTDTIRQAIVSTIETTPPIGTTASGARHSDDIRAPLALYYRRRHAISSIHAGRSPRPDPDRRLHYRERTLPDLR